MSNDAKTTADLPPKDQKPAQDSDKGSSSLPPSEADAVKGGSMPKPPGLRTNHNQTLRARRAAHQ